MLVDEWIETVWTVLSVREKTLKDYKHLYKSHLKPVIGLLEFGPTYGSAVLPPLTVTPVMPCRPLIIFRQLVLE